MFPTRLKYTAIAFFGESDFSAVPSFFSLSVTDSETGADCAVVSGADCAVVSDAGELPPQPAKIRLAAHRTATEIIDFFMLSPLKFFVGSIPADGC